MRNSAVWLLICAAFLLVDYSAAFRATSTTMRGSNAVVRRGILDMTSEDSVDGPSQPEDADREVDDVGFDNMRIEDALLENAPSELQIRMNLMGFTPLTIAGFALAGVIIVFNNVLGYGWASEFLGLDSTTPIIVESDNSFKALQGNGNLGGGGRQLQLDEKLMEARDGLIPVEIETTID